MTLNQAIVAAHKADDAFSSAITAAGYKSRWDWDKTKDRNPDLLAAYCSKLEADNIMSKCFAANR